jgi:hypothetical protein
LRSGTPLTTYIGTDANGDSIFNDRPLVNPGQELRRNFFRNRNIYDVDVRIQKKIKFGENRRLILSTEFFNILNLPNVVFPFPGTNSTSGPLLQYCASPSSTLCGLSGVTNPNFLNFRTATGEINSSSVTPASQAFQMQLGARFQF